VTDGVSLCVWLGVRVREELSDCVTEGVCVTDKDGDPVTLGDCDCVCEGVRDCVTLAV